VSSPDGAIIAFLGDANIPVFTVPNRLTEMGGLGEGSRYDLPGMSTIMRRYQTGAQIAVEWGSQRVGHDCQNPKTTQARDLPQESGMIDFAYSQGGPMLTLLAGEASFECSRHGAPGAAFIFAATQKVTMETWLRGWARTRSGSSVRWPASSRPAPARAKRPRS
jgi:hypothetical protein